MRGEGRGVGGGVGGGEGCKVGGGERGGAQFLHYLGLLSPEEKELVL
jgi:hypothetical protein